MVLAGNDILSAKDIYDALTVPDEIVKGLTTFHCSFTDSSKKSTKPTNLFPGITQFFSFDFENSGVRTRCQYGIGQGKITKKDKLVQQLNSTLKVEDEGGLDGPFWCSLDSSENEKKVVEEEDEEINRSDMFYCSTPGCTREFLSTRWLIEHEISGDHQFKVKKESRTDDAVKKCNKLIETREIARMAVTEHVEAVGDPGQRCGYSKGWAFKSAHKSFGLDDVAREKAEEYFHSQRVLNRRADGRFMRQKLEDAKDPSDPTGNRYLLKYSQVPSEKQLTGLFSRLEFQLLRRILLDICRIFSVDDSRPKSLRDALHASENGDFRPLRSSTTSLVVEIDNLGQSSKLSCDGPYKLSKKHKQMESPKVPVGEKCWPCCVRIELSFVVQGEKNRNTLRDIFGCFDSTMEHKEIIDKIQRE